MEDKESKKINPVPLSQKQLDELRGKGVIVGDDGGMLSDPALREAQGTPGVLNFLVDEKTEMYQQFPNQSLRVFHKSNEALMRKVGIKDMENPPRGGDAYIKRLRENN